MMKTKPKSVLLLGGLGYSGSRLYQYLLDEKYSVASIDLEWFTTLYNLPNIPQDFSTLNTSYIQNFDVVILLAGHSSVQACKDAPLKSVLNNCTYFFDLLGKLKPEQKLIYASSASVYGESGEKPAKESFALPKPIMAYDRQKQLIDKYISVLNPKFTWYSMRLGTLCGYSKNPRLELMINSMVKAALLNEKILISNPDSYRAILGLNDFCRAVHAMIEQNRPSGFYNLASFNSKIGDIGNVIADLFMVPVDIQPPTPTYSFCLDTSKFEQEFNFTFQETPEIISLESAKNDLSKIRIEQYERLAHEPTLEMPGLSRGNA